MNDLISKQVAINALAEVLPSLTTPDESGLFDHEIYIAAEAFADCIRIVSNLPSAQTETCEGCKHLGKWENEVEYGYSSPCTRCKRRVNDNYER